MEVPAAQGHHEAAALRSSSGAVHNNKPPAANARPWSRGGASAAPPPPPPKVYRVEPREFRDLVQRLTGAPPTALRRPAQHQQHHHQHHQRVVVQPQPVRPGVVEQQQQVYGAPAPSWFSFPMAGTVEAQPQHGAFL